MEKPKQKRRTLNKTDLKVIDLLQKTTNALTLQEIANKTGEAPAKIAQSLCKLLSYNEKFLTEMLLQIYL